MILCYLKGAADKGMIIKPTGKLNLELWCDTNFAGPYNHDPSQHKHDLSQVAWSLPRYPQ